MLLYNNKIIAEKNPTNTGEGGVAVVVASAAPSDTSALWVDTSNSFLLKIYNVDKWQAVSAAWAE